MTAIAGDDEEDSLREGAGEIERHEGPMALVVRDGFLAAEVEADDSRPVTAEDVRAVLEQLRR